MSLPISRAYFNELSTKAPTVAIVKNNKDDTLWNRLHILQGDVPRVTEGRILGLDRVGIIVQIGGRVSNFNIGDLVLNLPGAILYWLSGMYKN
jgi:alcohol dehydrogenase